MQFKMIRPLYVRDTERMGRGVFCSESLNRGNLIEICPIILFPRAQYEASKGTRLYDYPYEYDAATVAIALGYGSLYNHSFEPNAYYEIGNNSVKIKALTDIPAKTEITINYNGDPKDKTPLWFDVV